MKMTCPSPESVPLCSVDCNKRAAIDVPKKLTNGVQLFEHPRATEPADINWESVRIFLRLVQAGSFRKAARRLGVSANTIRNQVHLLERQLGTPLILRGSTGVEPTADGERIFERATRMEEASFDLRRSAGSPALGVSGEIRISITEGLGTFWVMPKLAGFQRANPRLIVELNTTMRPSDPVRLEADVGVQISPPTNPALKAFKIGRMHAMPFASREYLATYGTPESLADVPRHRIVEQLSPQLYNDQVDVLFPDVAREGFVAVRANTSTAHYWAVAAGAGLGMLPTYLWVIGAEVEPVEIGLRTQFDIWLTYHPDMRQGPRVASTIEWLKQAFDPKTYPWFRDEFVPPEELREYRVHHRFSPFGSDR